MYCDQNTVKYQHIPNMVKCQVHDDLQNGYLLPILCPIFLLTTDLLLGSLQIFYRELYQWNKNAIMGII